MTAEKFLADFCEPAASDIKMCCGGEDRNGDAGFDLSLGSQLAPRLLSHRDYGD